MLQVEGSNSGEDNYVLGLGRARKVMRIYRSVFTLTIFFAAITLGFTSMVWSGSANQNVSPQEPNQQETPPADDVPLLDLKQAEKSALNS